MSVESRFIPEQVTRNIREKYLEALAVSLGADETIAKLNAKALVAAHADGALPIVDYTKDKYEQNPKDITTIGHIGSWFLTGSPQQDQLKFTVGSRVLSLLNEDTGSGSFTHLRSWVGVWTDGDGCDKFQELIDR